MQFVYTTDPGTHDFCESIGMPLLSTHISEKTVFWCFVLTEEFQNAKHEGLHYCISDSLLF